MTPLLLVVSVFEHFYHPAHFKQRHIFLPFFIFVHFPIFINDFLQIL